MNSKLQAVCDGQGRPLNRKTPISHDRVLYRQRHKIENMFGRLKDWWRIHTRYDPMRSYLHVRNLHRCFRHLLALINES